MIHTLRRLFGRKPTARATQSEADDNFLDEGTTDMLLSSLDLVEHMRRQGADLSLQREVTHLFLGTGEDLRRAAKLLSHQGYQVLELDEERLVAGEDAQVSEAWVQKVIPAMCITAGEFGLFYDGWDADTDQQIDRDN